MYKKKMWQTDRQQQLNTTGRQKKYAQSPLKNDPHPTLRSNYLGINYLGEMWHANEQV